MFFVAPVLILTLLGGRWTWELSLPEVVAVVVSVYVLFQISSDGETNWIEGIQLLSLYLILGIFSIFRKPAAHRTQASRDLTVSMEMLRTSSATSECRLANQITNYGA